MTDNGKILSLSDAKKEEKQKTLDERISEAVIAAKASDAPDVKVDENLSKMFGEQLADNLRPDFQKEVKKQLQGLPGMNALQACMQYMATTITLINPSFPEGSMMAFVSYVPDDPDSIAVISTPGCDFEDVKKALDTLAERNKQMEIARSV